MRLSKKIIIGGGMTVVALIAVYGFVATVRANEISKNWSATTKSVINTETLRERQKTFESFDIKEEELAEKNIYYTSDEYTAMSSVLNDQYQDIERIKKSIPPTSGLGFWQGKNEAASHREQLLADLNNLSDYTKETQARLALNSAIAQSYSGAVGSNDPTVYLKSLQEAAGAYKKFSETTYITAKEEAIRDRLIELSALYQETVNAYDRQDRAAYDAANVKFDKLYNVHVKDDPALEKEYADRRERGMKIIDDIAERIQSL